MARLLVVEDEPDILALIDRRILAAGHELMSAGSGAAALELIDARGLPDAAVLDVDLPDMDGFVLLEKLRRHRPGMPVVFITALLEVGIAARAADAGGPLLSKPFTLSSLDALINEAAAAPAVRNP